MNLLPAILKRGAAAALVAAAWTAGAADATNQPVFHASWRAASAAAAADQSLVLLIFGAEWCDPCRQLKNETLAASEFRLQAEPLHVVEVDVDTSKKMAQDFAVEAIPTLVLLTADGKITGRHTGFVNTAEMTAFLENGRRRADLGQWDGLAPASPLDDYVKKAAADTLTTNDLRRLVEMLGEPDPGDRAGLAGILLGQREQAMPWLIEGVNNPYLGARIGAAELLLRLAPGAPAVDPWRSPEELAAAVADLRKWWESAGTLPPAAQARTADPALENSIKAELETLRGDDPVRRTEAMAALAGAGADALPAVREALRRAEKSGDQRVIGWLEDVRWAILIPDTLEQQAGGVRKILARGKSLDRQAAAERLGKVGAEALGALTELVNDNDSLVAESAARALSEAGGAQTIPALAALLAAADSNLRMTAAQALGHTKSGDAIKPLLTAVDDANEVVACTALAALQEARNAGDYLPSSRSVPQEISAALKRCLGDTRWRVRAAAAEAAGKMGAHDTAGEVKKLLEDKDGFVVQKALAALNQLGAPPDTRELAAIARRLPGLRGGVVEMMLRSKTKETADAVTEMFNSSDVNGQTAILQAMAAEGGGRDVAALEFGLNAVSIQGGNPGGPEDEADWKSLLTKAASSPEVRLRRGAAEALRRQPARLSAELIGPLLSDEDAATRAAAADVVLSILITPASPPVAVRPGAPVKTNSPPAGADQLAAWHAALLQRTNAAPSLRLVAALLATGDPKKDWPLVLAALDKPETSPARRSQDAEAIGLILAKLPWPEGRPVLDKLSGSPILFVFAAQRSSRAAPAAADYLLEPARFKAAVEPASGETLKAALESVAGYNSMAEGTTVTINGVAQEAGSLWNLWCENDRVKAITLVLAQCTNAAWRAAAVYSLGQRADAEQNAAIFEKAMGDANEWVRRAAAQALGRRPKDRAPLESRLGPMLSDTSVEVAGVAAVLLLEPEVRQAASLEGELNYFEFDGSYGGRMDFGTTVNLNNERPLTTLEGKPAFLAHAAKWAATAKGGEAAPFVVLLAQYGQFDGLDRLLAQSGAARANEQRELDDAILTGIALSQDAKYLPALRKMTAAQNNDYQLRKILQAIQGMRGADARQLRLDINKKLRTVSSP
jgi:HEAT repeat protein/thiol-disulfide isomerase/thioredoxin